MLNSFWWVTKGENGKGIHWMSWDRLTMRKERGGMGFRSIYGFNLAMLGKQGSCLGHNPSYVWGSIWSSRIVLREGYRWRIGDGSKIPI
ncbi:ribonuclease H [Trifolium pratense]|uniref:Ribonuclease H n=1 Tax=Trifolium pratense TaxID=57577 RepID=A0A2K3L8C8_TRIPR|nr:ribonuclease H [Trifolium pratense]